MATKTKASGEIETSFHFPYAGLDVSRHFSRQPVRPVGDMQKYSRTTSFAMNVRGYDGMQNRLRGGSRPGISRYIDQQVSGEHLIQGMNLVVGTGYTAPGGNVQTSQSGRLVTLVAVSNGDVKIANPGDTVWTSTINGTGALNTTGVVYSAPNLGKLYFADGVHEKYYDPQINTVSVWTATQGVMPQDSAGNKPRGIATWRNRTMLWGWLLEPHNIVASAVDSPTNFDYTPTQPLPTQAFKLNISTLGQIGDVVTAGIPFTDDTFVVGGDHSIAIIQGDPMDGGRVLTVSTSIGMAWGQPWCQGPNGEIYFFSNQCGIYVMTPGQPMVRISQPIENLLRTVNTGANTITMVWDDRFQGFHVFVTRTSMAYRAIHLFYEARTQAWWMDTFANKNHNPLCCCTFDGNLPTDRVALIGSWEGYVRYLNPDALDDDGYKIASRVVIGPFLTRDLDEVRLSTMQAVLGVTSGEVNYSLLLGRTPEAALASTPVATGILKGGRNSSKDLNRSAYAIYVNLESTNPWAMEEFTLKLMQLGMIRRRGA